MSLDRDIKKFHGQEHPNTCGIASLRTVLHGRFGIKKSESGLIELAESLYEEKRAPKRKKKDYKIVPNGTGSYHFVNIAEHFGLKAFYSFKGNLESIITLLDHDIWPIICRPFVNNDKDGHYVTVYGHNPKKRTINVFDPSYPGPGERPEGLTKQPGNHLIETYEQFDKNWLFNGFRNYRYLTAIFKDPKDFKISAKGRYF